MQPTVHALRAITAVVFWQYLARIAATTCIILTILYGLVIWGMSINSWWGVCLLLLFPLTAVAVVLFVGCKWSLSRFQPRDLTRAERQQIAKFSKRLLTLSNLVRQPWPWLAFRIGSGVLRGKESTLIRETINQSSELKKSFKEIVGLFS